MRQLHDRSDARQCVQGTIPLTTMNAPRDAPQAITAKVNCMTSRQGHRQRPIQNDGSFNIAAVPPGSYTSAAGIVPVLVTTRTVSVQSAQMSSINFTPFTQCYAECSGGAPDADGQADQSI
jgi:hypothetical protein